MDTQQHNRSNKRASRGQPKYDTSSASICWCKLLNNGEILGPIKLKFDGAPVDVDDIKKSMKNEFKAELNDISRARLEVFAANDPDTTTPLMVDDKWNVQAHGGDTAKTSLIVKAPIPATLHAPDKVRLERIEEQIHEIKTAVLQQQQHSDSTILISEHSTTVHKNVIAELGIPLDTPEWNEKPSGFTAAKSNFSWLKGKEDSPQNRKKYMAYLNDIKYIVFPPCSKLFDTAGKKKFFNVKMLGYHIVGSIGVVLAADRHQDATTVQVVSNMWAGIELKKNATGETCQRQAILQHLAASFLNPDEGILTILTDIYQTWCFYWFSKQKNRLMKYKASCWDEATYLIRNMMEKNSQISTPQDFLNRASLNEMLQVKPSSIIKDTRENDPKRKGPSKPSEQQQNNQESGGSSVNDRAQGDPDVMMDTLDFMDEEEEREAKFVALLDCILPQLGFTPQHRSELDYQAKNVPKYIEFLRDAVTETK